MSIIGDNVCKIREYLKEMQIDFAPKMGVKLGVLKNIEAGSSKPKKPLYEAMEALYGFKTLELDTKEFTPAEIEERIEAKKKSDAGKTMHALSMTDEQQVLNILQNKASIKALTAQLVKLTELVEKIPREVTFQQLTEASSQNLEEYLEKRRW